ncbi:MAG: ATPase domain-containing protein [Elusimicrobiota bacterium]|nr:ATPase domain-containing protein [Elusimicrobiota bacterium]
MAFECVECGYKSLNWMGRCPRCDSWDSIVESSKYESDETGKTAAATVSTTEVKKLSEIKNQTGQRIKSSIKSFDRIIGGGLVNEEILLLAGPPGVGKSTLFLQLAQNYSKSGFKVIFVSGEESPGQIKVHARRLAIKGDKIIVVGSGDLGEIKQIVDKVKPDILFVDSIQAVVTPGVNSAPGTLKQVKESGLKLTSIAKNTGTRVIVSGQITKQGTIAGPKVLEHIVDAVIYMDSIEQDTRLITAAKNRFGSCGDFALFNLTAKGLKEADELAGSLVGESAVGQVASCVAVGPRLIGVQLQALVSENYFEYPLRRTSGYSRNRLLMLTAIAQKYLGLKPGKFDIYLNITGHNTVKERASDLGVIAAVYSGFKDIPVRGTDIFLGEVGLNGKVLSLKDIQGRVKFAARNNYKRVILSSRGMKLKDPGVEIRIIDSVREIKEIFKGGD